ncbi:hypothetical protein DID88_000879 [Monilinia fructigena]|uniref:Sphingolipid delta4-desaturase N-terminal domain-containing protein n=1 Tax=Monilinia fructigena TaxID=38457 RepID=A0A395IYR6_9HELO|nr:hypothetical protein DID88_000879 [Monilinia fructigena]
MPPVATSTITTSTSNGSATQRLRVNEGDEVSAKTEEITSPQVEIEVKEHDFFWTYTEEPHRSRRLAIIKAHQRNANLNRALAIFANLPIGIPYSASFRPYHLTHHKSLGVDGLDTDLPTRFEALFLDSLLGKAFFCTFQILFYAIRPIFVYAVPFTSIHILNIISQVAFDILLVKMTGSYNSLYYLILSAFLAGSLHPCAGHFIAEHYVFTKPPLAARDPKTGLEIPETFSYYGPLNFFTYNVGLHNEHHDFPAVPWTRLPALHELAKEFYAELPRHESWIYVIWQFVWDKEVGMTCRVKRKEGGRKVGGWTQQEVQA